MLCGSGAPAMRISRPSTSSRVPHHARVPPIATITAAVIASLARRATGGSACASRWKRKWRPSCTPAAAPKLIAELSSSSVSGSVQLGESLST
jgi:hypothetical protein